MLDHAEAFAPEDQIDLVCAHARDPSAQLHAVGELARLRSAVGRPP